MATARAELSSIASTLTELTRRVTTLAERARDGDGGGGGDGRNGGGGGSDLAAELFAVERDLRAALRRLDRVSSEHGPRS